MLYAIHEENGAQPETAIFEAIKTFGDDVDRNKILNAARSSAEALTRKQKSLQSNAKFKPTMTVAEKAKELKQASVLKLYSEMEDAWDMSCATYIKQCICKIETEVIYDGPTSRRVPPSQQSLTTGIFVTDWNLTFSYAYWHVSTGLHNRLT